MSAQQIILDHDKWRKGMGGASAGLAGESDGNAYAGLDLNLITFTSSSFHGDAKGGENVFRLIARALIEPEKHIDLLELFFVILRRGSRASTVTPATVDARWTACSIASTMWSMPIAGMAPPTCSLIGNRLNVPSKHRSRRAVGTSPGKHIAMSVRDAAGTREAHAPKEACPMR
jgi:hypothetical protein